MAKRAEISGARARTRRALLSAAVSLLARDRSATLADIALAAEVGRSTLHRHFADRDELIRAAVENSFRELDRLVTEAALEEGPPLEAMRRLVAALVEAGDRLLFLFRDPRTLEGFEGANADEQPVLALIERGQAQGVFDPDVSAWWIQSVLWGLVYTGCEAAHDGRLSRHAVTSTVIRTFENGVLVR